MRFMKESVVRFFDAIPKKTGRDKQHGTTSGMWQIDVIFGKIVLRSVLISGNGERILGRVIYVSSWDLYDGVILLFLEYLQYSLTNSFHCIKNDAMVTVFPTIAFELLSKLIKVQFQSSRIFLKPI